MLSTIWLAIGGGGDPENCEAEEAAEQDRKFEISTKQCATRGNGQSDKDGGLQRLLVLEQVSSD